MRLTNCKHGDIMHVPVDKMQTGQQSRRKKKMTRAYTIADTETLRNLCIENNWFTAGSHEQYEKLFEANESGEATVREIAMIIWLCTDPEDAENFGLASIEIKLEIAQREYEDYHKYEILWDEDDEYGRHTYREIFVGGWFELRELIADMKTGDRYNIDANYIGIE